MLVRFFNHGKVKKGFATRSGGGGDVQSYLLFDRNDKTKPREGARLIYGDDAVTTEIINGIKNSKLYTSGVLSFAPEESITDTQKIEIIESFEANLFPGMIRGEYSGYWVEHVDKDRQELHFVFADIHLPTGRSLTVYYHHKDLDLVDSWKDLINFDYGLADPNDANRQRVYRLKGYEYAHKKMHEKQIFAEQNSASLVGTNNVGTNKVFIEEEIALHLVETILSDNSIESHEDVVRLIGEMFEITRIDKKGKSISIKNPNGGRNIKLKGMLYEREFTRQSLENFRTTKTKEPATRAKLAELNEQEVGRRLRRLQQRFKQYYESHRELGQQVDQQLTEPGYTSDRRPSDNSQPEPSAVSQSVGANSADAEQNNRSNPANQSEIRNITVSDFRESAPKPKAFQGIRQQLGRTSQDPHEAERDGVSGLLPSPSAKTSEPESQGNDDWDDYLRFSLDSNASNAGDDLLLKTLDEPTATAIGSGGTIDRTTTAAVGADFSENSADTGRGSSINDGDRVTQRPRSQANADYSQKSTASEIWFESQKAIGVTDSARRTKSKSAAKQQGITHDPTYQSKRAHHPKLTNIVERFAQSNDRANQPGSPESTNPDERNTFSIDTRLARSAYTDYRRRNPRPSAAAASEDGDLLTRIKDHQSTAAKNAKIRQGRISALTRQNATSLERIRQYTANRRQRVQTVTKGLGKFNHYLTAQQHHAEQRSEVLNHANQGLSAFKDGYEELTSAFHSAAESFRQFTQAVSTLANAIGDLFKRRFDELKRKAMTYAKAGRLYETAEDGSKGAQATTEQVQQFVDSHPPNMSGFTQLSENVKRWEAQALNNEPSGPSFGP